MIYKELARTADGEVGDDQGERPNAGSRQFARASPVFAAEQVDGWTDPHPAVATAPAVIPVARPEAFVTATGATVLHEGTHAFYRPATNTIQLPPRDSFTGTPTNTPTDSYYAVLLHELTHWTGPPSRCDRELGHRFGAGAYAMEELIAELGAAFICAERDLTPEPRPDHAHYLDHWITIMKADKRAIFTAVSKASAAADYLASLTQAAIRSR